MAVSFLIIVFVFVQVTHSAYSPGANKLCLSCQGISNPHACMRFVQVWQSEVCTSERVVQTDGTTVWNLGYEEGIACQVSDITGRRFRRTSNLGITECHECCHTDLCNHRLCNSAEYNGLACLSGMDSFGLPSDTTVTYCNPGELCYVNQPTHSRPGHFQRSCASQAMCRRFPANSPHVMCQRCCNTDGCNAHACDIVPVYSDCWDLRTRGGFRETGIYDIYPPPGNTRMRVRCDMQTDGGGWTVIYRRYDGSLSFAERTFNNYAEGFGEVYGEFWFGLENVYHIASHSSPLTLRVDVCKRSNLHSPYAEYDTFSVGGRNDSYRLHIGLFAGTARDRLRVYNSAPFTVSDSCATTRGAWWYGNQCPYPGLNGANIRDGIYWDGYESAAEMKMRPMLATGDSIPYTCPVQ